jgi:hypothetical protein
MLRLQAFVETMRSIRSPRFSARASPLTVTRSARTDEDGRRKRGDDDSDELMQRPGWLQSWTRVGSFLQRHLKLAITAQPA